MQSPPLPTPSHPHGPRATAAHHAAPPPPPPPAGIAEAPATATPRYSRGSPSEVLAAFLRLGLTSFGGPIAHLGYFRAEFVERRAWLNDRAYADLVGLCQFLPGPASSQVGFALGLLRAGWLGGLAAWIAFTLPSALLLTVFAYAAAGPLQAVPFGAGLLHGLKLAAVAVVAQAVWGMARPLCPDRTRATLAAGAAALAAVAPASWSQLLAIAAAAAAGAVLCRAAPEDAASASNAAPASALAVSRVTRRAGVACLAAFCVLLALSLVFPSFPGAFYRAGALVFGGGHVVLPLLRDLVVQPGWVGEQAFLAGYGAAQAVPGPLFAFAAYLGAAAHGPADIPADGLAGGPVGAAVALVAIFLPGLLLVAGALPYWAALQGHPGARAALRGVNAAVVGLLGAALYDPVWTGTVQHGPADFALALAGFVLLTAWRAPPLLVVCLLALAGVAMP